MQSKSKVNQLLENRCKLTLLELASLLNQRCGLAIRKCTDCQHKYQQVVKNQSEANEHASPHGAHVNFSFIMVDLRLAVEFHSLGKTQNEGALVKNEGVLENSEGETQGDYWKQESLVRQLNIKAVRVSFKVKPARNEVETTNNEGVLVQNDTVEKKIKVAVLHNEARRAQNEGRRA